MWIQLLITCVLTIFENIKANTSLFFDIALQYRNDQGPFDLKFKLAQEIMGDFNANKTGIVKYSVMQSDLNSSKTDTFQEPTAYEPYVYQRSKQMITFARHEYGRVGVFIIRIRSLVQKI